MSLIRTVRIWLATMIDPDITFRQRRIDAYNADREYVKNFDETLP